MKDEMGRPCSMNGGELECIQGFGRKVKKRERERPLGRPGCRRDNIVKMYVQEIGWGGLDWFNLASDR
jgi:hypothetical protein